jgi:hypothetical protein
MMLNLIQTNKIKMFYFIFNKYMEIQDLKLNKYNDNETIELKKLFLIKKQNENIFEYLRKINEEHNETIEKIFLVIEYRKAELENIYENFSENNKHLKNILLNLSDK